jgi:hypothetical protein
VGDDHGVHLLRISLLDRPGALGAVATALGEAGANIHAMEVVERAGGYVVEDFLVRLPPGRLIDTLVAACHKVPDVSVEWVSRYPSDGNLQSDLETLERQDEGSTACSGNTHGRVACCFPRPLGAADQRVTAADGDVGHGDGP